MRDTTSSAGAAGPSPADPPDGSFKGALLRTWRAFSRDRILAVAAGCAFYMLLAVFPALAALVSIYGLVGDAHTIERTMAALADILPGGAISIVREELSRLLAQGGSKLGLAFAAGLAAAVWSANSGMKAMFDALDVAYQEEERRGFLRLNATSLAFTAGALVFAIGAVALLTVAPAALTFPALLAAMLLALAALYRYGPDRAKPKREWVTWGSAFATLAWLAMSAGFTFYAANFGSFDKTYGSLGAAVGLMLWMWLSVTVVLVGAALNCEIERRAEAQGADTKDETP